MPTFMVTGSYITGFDFTIEADSLEDARAKAPIELREEYLPTDVLIYGYDIDHIDVFEQDDD